MQATITQRLSWAEMVRSGKTDSEDARVYAAIRDFGPCNYHTIMEKTGLPVNHCVRAIHSLTRPKEGMPLVVVAYEAKSPKTNRLVQFYKINNGLLF